MCRYGELDLPATAHAAARARDFVRDRCLEWRLGALADDLILLTSELVTNVLLHAGSVSTLTLSVANGTVEVSVTYDSPESPVLRPQRTDLLADLDAIPDTEPLPTDPRDPALHVGEAGAVTAGRGLHVVDALASQWGIAPRTHGKSIWLTVEAPNAWPFQYDCVCESSPTHTTASGHPVANMLDG